jgi:uncharacterized lipoprotein YddW (UPF0748 family)
MTRVQSHLFRFIVTLLVALGFGLGIQSALARSSSPFRDVVFSFPRQDRELEDEVISTTSAYTISLPLILNNHPIVPEVRALWITRFDWTSYHHTVTTTDIDVIVDNVASANFNLILFQIRGTADAYYSSTLEPWASRLTGEVTQTLGQSPGFDPLAYMIDRAHDKGIQVHAYMNVYPTWLCGYGAPPSNTTPQHLFWTLSYSTTWSAWRMHDDTYTPMNLNTCDSYLSATPALSLTRNHIAAVAVDLATRYDIDGIHLDNVRYAGSNYSYDPFTQQAFTDALTISPTLVFNSWLPNFQRDQVTQLVAQIYSATVSQKPNLWISAAVWPNYSTGYNSYFQDSKGWLANGTLDASMPMLYSSDVITNLTAWTNRAQGFIDDAYGRYVIPGISADYVDFKDIADRIAAARSMNATGIALFSYGALNSHQYWDDLANGPFALQAIIPQPSWK